MASIKSLYYKKIAQDILDDNNNDYKWLNIKLKKHFKIDTIDKINNYFVKPNDCRWWFGNTKKIRYNNLCKKMPRGNRKEMQMLLEHIINLRISYTLFIPPHPISGYKFEKDITIPGSYQLCYKGVVVNKIIQNNEKNNNEEDNKCPICFEVINIEKNYIATLCGHKFCSICIFKNIDLGNEQCPLCRANITGDKNNIDLNYQETEREFRRFEAPNAPRRPTWIFPRTPPPQPERTNRFPLRTPQHIIDRVNQDIENELNPLITINEQRLYREDLHNLSRITLNRPRTTTSIIRLHPSISRNQNTPINTLFTENDISQIRTGYNQPILNALEEIREFYSDSSENELLNTTEMTGIFEDVNDSITNSPVIFYNDNNEVTDEMFTNELTQALNEFIDENTNNTIQHQISDSNLTTNIYTPPLTRNRELIDNDEYYYFYNDIDDSEPLTPPQPISPPTRVFTPTGFIDILNSFQRQSIIEISNNDISNNDIHT